MTRKIPKRFFPIAVLLAGVIGLLVVVGCVGTQESQTRYDTILANKLLRIGTTGDFMPFSYRFDGASELHGVDIVFGQRLGNAMGVDVQFVATTWPGLINDLLADKFDVGLSGITITEERLKVSSFSLPIMSSGKVAITRDENAGRFQTIECINRPDVRVIVNPGGTNEAFARQNFPRSTIILNAENITVFNKIVSGAADVMVTDAVEAAVQEKIHPALEISNRDAPFNSFEFGILLPEDPVLKAIVNSWLEIQLDENAYQQLFELELEKIETEFDASSH